MKIGIAGYGRMGHEVESAAGSMGHETLVVSEAGMAGSGIEEMLNGVDVVIEFTVPSEAPALITRILRAGVPVVSGTTGWLERYDAVAAIALRSNTSFIHSSNYSPGVYILSKVNSYLAECMRSFRGYRASIDEVHHAAKLDAPSGTAIMLAGQIIAAGGYNAWKRGEEAGDAEIPVRSVREGLVPGIHHVKWRSAEDVITLSHEAFGRRGFAVGAVMAAEFITGRKGVFTIGDVFGF